jgi:hypothetical protein
MKNKAVALVALGLTTTPGLANAQAINMFARDRNVAVTERPHPEYEAIGLRAGTFSVYPKVDLDLGYEDNIFASETNEQSDTIYRIAPRVDAASQWSRHSLTAFARAVITRYSDFETENNDSWSVGANGRLDVTREAVLGGGLEYGREIEPRTASSSPGSLAEPVRFDVLRTYATATRTFTRLRLSARADLRKYDYEDVRSVSGAILEQDYRDQTNYEFTGRGDYAVSPALAVFGSVSLNNREHETTSNPLIPNRDSSGYNILAGVDFELGELTRGFASVGYIEQTFDSAIYGELSGISSSVSLEYFPSPLLTLGGTINRSVSDSGIIGVAGFLVTNAEIRADYEFRRNIIIGSRLGYTQEDFESLDVVNDRWYAGLRATYLLNRRLGLTASYDYETRNADERFPIGDFDANRFLISVVAQY